MENGAEQYPEYVTTGFVAGRCGVCNVTVLRWIQKGHLPAFRLPDGHYRIHRDDFASFLKRYRIPLHHNTSGNRDTSGGQ